MFLLMNAICLHSQSRLWRVFLFPDCPDKDIYVGVQDGFVCMYREQEVRELS